MTGAAKTRGGLAGMCVLAGVLVALTQFGPIAKDGASLLLALLFWATVIEIGRAHV